MRLIVQDKTAAGASVRVKHGRYGDNMPERPLFSWHAKRSLVTSRVRTKTDPLRRAVWIHQLKAIVLLNGRRYGGYLRIVAKEAEKMGLFSLSHVMRDVDGGAGRCLGCTALIVKPREP